MRLRRKKKQDDDAVDDFQDEIFRPITKQNNITIRSRVDENLTSNISERCKRVVIMTKLSSASDGREKRIIEVK